MPSHFHPLPGALAFGNPDMQVKILNDHQLAGIMPLAFASVKHHCRRIARSQFRAPADAASATRLAA